MSKLQERLDAIVEDFELFDDELEKYEYMVDLGKGLHPINEIDRNAAYLIQGCTSQVWIIPSAQNGNIIFQGDSNTVIVKGLVAILLKVFSNASPQEILDFDLEALNKLGLAEIVTPTRQNGFKSIVNKIIEYAKGIKND